ncbi:hypothetical protein [Streptomyces sp. Tue6028]|uniref:hypothetical protein n=1 Tax=Streptomyces sp. Tue6028 TaxID=2036037 RepID=UPI003D733D25
MEIHELRELLSAGEAYGREERAAEFTPRPRALDTVVPECASAYAAGATTERG